MKILQFLDHLIPYETFLNDLSSRIVRQLKADKDDPEFISQRKAYELFGRRNVERWKRQGKVVSYKDPVRWNIARQTSGSCSVPPRIILMKVSRNRLKDQSKKTNDKHIMADILIVINYICLI